MVRVGRRRAIHLIVKQGFDEISGHGTGTLGYMLTVSSGVSSELHLGRERYI